MKGKVQACMHLLRSLPIIPILHIGGTKCNHTNHQEASHMRHDPSLNKHAKSSQAAFYSCKTRVLTAGRCRSDHACMPRAHWTHQEAIKIPGHVHVLCSCKSKNLTLQLEVNTDLHVSLKAFASERHSNHESVNNGQQQSIFKAC